MLYFYFPNIFCWKAASVIPNWAAASLIDSSPFCTSEISVSITPSARPSSLNNSIASASLYSVSSIPFTSVLCSSRNDLITKPSGMSDIALSTALLMPSSSFVVLFLLIRTGNWTICPYTERYLLPYGIISSLPLALSCNQILPYNRHHFNETSACVGHVTECFSGCFCYQMYSLLSYRCQHESSRPQNCIG